MTSGHILADPHKAYDEGNKVALRRDVGIDARGNILADPHSSYDDTVIDSSSDAHPMPDAHAEYASGSG